MSKRRSKAGQVMSLFATTKDEALTLYDVATETMRQQGYIGKRSSAAKNVGRAAKETAKPPAAA